MNKRSGRQKPMSNTMFKMISLTAAVFYKVMNLSRQLQKSGVRGGQTVLDFGCGSGHFTIAAASMVGDNGKVYALDMHPLAIEAVKKKVAKEGLPNVRTILSDRDTGLPDESVDVVLLYRTFYLVKDKQGLLDELHRVLKPDCILSVVGGGVADCLKAIGKDDRFLLAERGKRFLNFRKVKPRNKGVA
jgi:ubiquinone/menaquinone biosynthesis C-methylase UbiE